MNISSNYAEKNLIFKADSDSIVVNLNGNQILRITKDIASRLAASKNPNSFGYELEKELGIMINLMEWDIIFFQFRKTWEQIKKDDEKRVSEERLRTIEEEQINLRQKEAERAASPLEKSLQSLQLRRQCEDKMFAEIGHTFGLPKGSLAIDPSMLNLLQLSSVTSDQENPIDREYRKRFFLKILQLFDNECANCKSRDNGIHLDHFMIPRSKGGTFIINTKTGIAIHNAIPLCEPCNIKKSNKDYRLFFSADVLRKIFIILGQMTPADEFES